MYARVMDARALSSVIGEEELSDNDKKYISFGKRFEEEFIAQSFYENRTVEESLDIGWSLLSDFNESELDRISADIYAKYAKKQ